MTKHTCWILAIPFLLLTACGGGGSGSGGPTGVATSGNVFALNGQSASVGGVTIEVPGTGASVVSAADGSFDLGLLPATRLTLRVTPPGGSPFRTAIVVSSEVEVDLSGAAEASIHLSVTDDGVSEASVDRCSGSGSDSDTRASLTVVSGGSKGRVRVRVRDDGHTGFDVELELLAPGTVVQVTVINPTTSASESQGTLTADAVGEAELELRTNDGDRLPFGVADVSALEDFIVEVHDSTGATLLMTGVVPTTGVPPTCPASGGGGGGGGNVGRETGEALLGNASGVNGVAQVELRSRPARGEEKIEVEVTGTNVVGVIEVWLEDPANPGTLSIVGVLQATTTSLEFELDTENGDVLPYGVSQASGLVGLQIELRQSSDGAVVYSGVTPPLNPS